MGKSTDKLVRTWQIIKAIGRSKIEISPQPIALKLSKF